MSTLERVAIAVTLLAVAGAAVAGESRSPVPRLGQPMSAADAAKWDKTIFPDGQGLPPGHGTAKEGRALYEQKCAGCHGQRGEGATAEELVGEPKPPTGEDPSKAIGPYWPYATTIFDFISRSMPPAAPGSLSANETYAITAYLLAANQIIGEGDEIGAATLPQVKMPNRDGFVWIDVKK